MGGFPSQHGFQLFLAGDQDGGVTRPARRKLPWDFSTGDALSNFDNFQNGIASTIADIKGFTGDALNLLKRAQVGIRDIEDVNIVADASSIGGGVISAKDINMGDRATRRVQHSGNKMGFDTMRFAALFGCASGIEIAQRNVNQLGVRTIIGEDLLEYQLGFAIGIDGTFGVIFRDGHHLRFAVGGRSGRKNKLFDSVTNHGVEKIHATGYVCGVKGAGFSDGLGDQGFAGKVHHRVNFMLGEHFFNLRAYAEIRMAKDGLTRNSFAMALLQIIQRNYVYSARQQQSGPRPVLSDGCDFSAATVLAVARGSPIE